MDAQRFVRERAADWQRVRELAERAERRRFRGLAKHELDALALGYRRMASDLALARARFPGSQTVAELNRAVARTHNVVYRGRPTSWRDLRRTLAEEVPRTVRRHWRYLVTAMALFFVPAFVSYAVGVARPSLARALVPPAMIEAAEAGKLHTDEILSLMGSSGLSSVLVTNNLSVVFATFALGALAGLGTVYVLVSNGILIGIVLAFYAHHHLDGRLWSFLIGHGVIEISAVCLAGAAGLLVGDALLAPGSRSRRQALAENGPDAVRIVAGLIPVLAVAALVEGFISPSPFYPAPLKWALGVGLGVVLWLWLAIGGVATLDRTIA